MNHDYIELEFVEEHKQGPDAGKRKVNRIVDSNLISYSVQEHKESVHIYRTVMQPEPHGKHTTLVTVPWWRIYEIRYVGER